MYRGVVDKSQVQFLVLQNRFWLSLRGSPIIKVNLKPSNPMLVSTPGKVTKSGVVDKSLSFYPGLLSWIPGSPSLSDVT